MPAQQAQISNRQDKPSGYTSGHHQARWVVDGELQCCAQPEG
jgi:hypothetical protein